MVDVDIRILSHLKEELTWAADERLQVISTTIYLINSLSTKELKGTKNEATLNIEQYCLRCYVALNYQYILIASR